jgi:hypothetical protein
MNKNTKNDNDTTVDLVTERIYTETKNKILCNLLECGINDIYYLIDTAIAFKVDIINVFKEAQLLAVDLNTKIKFNYIVDMIFTTAISDCVDKSGIKEFNYENVYIEFNYCCSNLYIILDKDNQECISNYEECMAAILFCKKREVDNE